jgi:hypothetical protein
MSQQQLLTELLMALREARDAVLGGQPPVPGSSPQSTVLARWGAWMSIAAC